MEYLLVKWVHVLSSTLLFGTGLGSAFYMFFTNRSYDVRAIAVVSRRVVIADWLFTTPTAVIQPATGFYLLHLAGMPLSARWVVWSIALYIVAGACWLWGTRFLAEDTAAVSALEKQLSEKLDVAETSECSN